MVDISESLNVRFEIGIGKLGINIFGIFINLLKELKIILIMIVVIIEIIVI